MQIMSLVFEGKVVGVGETLKDCGAVDWCVVHVIAKLRSGGLSNYVNHNKEENNTDVVTESRDKHRRKRSLWATGTGLKRMAGDGMQESLWACQK